ncbi:MAG TPA: radical SAM protein, partial [Hellea balneolensis]|nr:radical SAM protein [Hellea balneolensis]
MHYWRKRTGPKALTSIHFGGGTPSLIPPNDLKHIIKAATTLWSPKTDIEMGIEANPNDIDEAQIKEWRSAGLNRVSIGVQSFDPQTLKFLGRDHSDVQARKAVTLARKWFKNVSADLIFGWRAQSLSAWTKDLNTAL